MRYHQLKKYIKLPDGIDFYQSDGLIFFNIFENSKETGQKALYLIQSSTNKFYCIVFEKDEWNNMDTILKHIEEALKEFKNEIKGS